jgi:hypothetical protein
MTLGEISLTVDVVVVIMVGSGEGAIKGIIVGDNEGMSEGEMEGPVGADVGENPNTLRTLWFVISEINKSPFESTKRPDGVMSCAEVGGPPSPFAKVAEVAAKPVPTTTDMTPSVAICTLAPSADEAYIPPLRLPNTLTQFDIDMEVAGPVLKEPLDEPDPAIVAIILVVRFILRTWF